MAIHVQDEEADWLLRDFARRRGVGLTAAIKLAVKEASVLERQSFESFQARLKPIVDQIANMPTLDKTDYGKLTDELWGEED
jgi:hypothetical protein